MPRAYDPSLIGNQLPFDHSPLNRIEYQTNKPEFDLDAIKAQLITFVEDFLFPIIEEITGIDLAVFLPLFVGLDFSSPEAFLESLTAALAQVIHLAITGVESLGDLYDDLTKALRNNPFRNILGIGGPGDIGGSIQSTWDQFVGGFVGTVGTGTSLADLFNIGHDVSARASLGQMGWDILGIRNNKSLNTGFLPTSESTIGLDTVALQATAPTFPVTQATAITGYQRISEAASKGVVAWQGSGVASITHCFVNIYKMNTTTGVNTLVHASANIVGLLSGTMQQNIYSLPTPIDVQPGEVYGHEIAIRGAGTHNVVGATSWLPDQSVFPRRYSSVRNAGTAAPPSSFTPTYGSNVPFLEFGVSASEVPLPRTPETTLFNTAGTSTLPWPTWANFAEIIPLAGGGGGRQGGTWGVSGEGGDNGTWNTKTWARGVDFLASATPSLSITVGAGGTGGGRGGTSGGIGNNGGNSTVTLPATTGHGSQTVTTVGGEGGDALGVLGSDSYGQSPGNQAYGGITYVGGGEQHSFGGPGAPAGGGGAGGDPVAFGLGGTGAPGAVWIRFRQT